MLTNAVSKTETFRSAWFDLQSSTKSWEAFIHAMNNPYRRITCLKDSKIEQVVITEPKVQNDKLVIKTSEDYQLFITMQGKRLLTKYRSKRLGKQQNSIGKLPVTIWVKSCLMSGIELKHWRIVLMALKGSCLVNCLSSQGKVVLVAHIAIPHSQLLLELPFSLQMDDQMLTNPFPQGPKAMLEVCYQ